MHQTYSFVAVVQGSGSCHNEKVEILCPDWFFLMQVTEPFNGISDIEWYFMSPQCMAQADESA